MIKMMRRPILWILIEFIGAWQCVKAENFEAASMLETMAENHEQALQHNLAGAAGSKGGSMDAINKYLASIDYTKKPNVEQVRRQLQCTAFCD